MQTLAARFRAIHGKARPLISTALYGLVASLAAVGFQWAIQWVYHLCYQRPAEGGFFHLAWVSLCVISASSLLVGWLLTSFCPEAAGSGIPQVKLGFWKEFGFSPKRIAWVKFIAGIASIGGGQSLGREGPTVQIGSSLASSLSGLLGVSKQNRRTASVAGAAAGLAAAFNAPLASIAFVLEEIIGDLNSRALGGVLIAAVIGAFVVHALVGAQPAFGLPQISEPSWRAYLLMPLAASFAAFTGIVFQRGSLSLRKNARTLRRFPKWLHPLAGGLITWVVGISVFGLTHRLGVFSLGYDDLSDALAHGMAWKIAGILLAGKLLVTIVCYGFGGCGGIFSPNLFLGAMCGAFVASAGSGFLALTSSDQLLLAVGGMSACLGAVVQAPVTAILIIFEMTHQFALVPGLMLAGLVSLAIARSLGRANFYEEILVQDGHDMEHLVPPRDLRSWQNLPVSAIANFKPVLLEDLSPEGLKALLLAHPYRRFPVMEAGGLKGVAIRSEIEASLFECRPVRPEAMLTSPPGESVRATQAVLIESPSGMVAITDKPGNGRVLAVVTLHDLLRTQLAMSERENGV